MKLQSQTCLLEQSQKLAELGVTAQSQCVHVLVGRFNPRECSVLPIKNICNTDDYIAILCQAYTVAELLQALPKSIGDYDLTIHNSSNHWFISYVNFEFDYRAKHSASNDSLPQLLAVMLIYFLENNLLTAEQVNEAINNG